MHRKFSIEHVDTHCIGVKMEETLCICVLFECEALDAAVTKDERMNQCLVMKSVHLYKQMLGKK